MDKISKQARSKIMAAVRGRGNKSTELRMAALLRENGLTGWRRHLPLAGRPDFAFRKGKIAVFVDGCFWHKCPLCFRAPKTSKAYWTAKIERNTKRDDAVTGQLQDKGWTVFRVWECQLKRPETFLPGLALACSSCI